MQRTTPSVFWSKTTYMFGTRKTSNSEKTPETDKCKKNGQKIKDHGRCQQNRSGTSNGIAVVCFCITFVVTQNHVEGLGQVCDHLGDLRSIGYVFFQNIFRRIRPTHFALPIMAAPYWQLCPVAGAAEDI